MAKRGKCPSLIGGGAGASRFLEAKGKRRCKRCGARIEKGMDCVEVAKPGSMGHRTYCTDCYSEILEQTRRDVKKLESILTDLG